MIFNINLEIKTVKARVNYILKYFESARSNDARLIQLYLDFFEDIKITLPDNGDEMAAVSRAISNAPRLRRVIQNEDGMYLPIPSVLENRKEKEKRMKVAVRSK